jgi:O-methyltransferase
MDHLRMFIKKFINLVFSKLGYHICAIQKKEYEEFKYRQLIKEIGGFYKNFIFHEMPPLDDVRINLMSDLLGTAISEAIYLMYYLNQSLNIDGDICEFGVAQGATSALMAHEIRKTDKNIWLFDSFEGLPKPTQKDILKDDIFGLGSIDKYEGKMACAEDLVKDRLKAIDFPASRLKIVKGFIESTVNQSYLPSSVCFAYVDFDFYEPILVALNFLDKVLRIGGVIIVDDYDYFSAGAKVAVDEFSSFNKEKYALNLPIESAGHFCVIEKIA